MKGISNKDVAVRLFNAIGDEMVQLLQRFETLLLKDKLDAKKQTSFLDFFEKNNVNRDL